MGWWNAALPRAREGNGPQLNGDPSPLHPRRFDVVLAKVGGYEGGNDPTPLPADESECVAHARCFENLCAGGFDALMCFGHSERDARAGRGG